MEEIQNRPTSAAPAIQIPGNTPQEPRRGWQIWKYLTIGQQGARARYRTSEEAHAGRQPSSPSATPHVRTLGESQATAAEQTLEPVASHLINLKATQDNIQHAFQALEKSPSLSAMAKKRDLIKQYQDLKTFHKISYKYSSAGERFTGSATTQPEMPAAEAGSDSVGYSSTALTNDSLEKRIIHDLDEAAGKSLKGKERQLPNKQDIEINEEQNALQNAIEQKKAEKLRQLEQRSSSYFPEIPESQAYCFLMLMRNQYASVSKRLDYPQRAFLSSLKGDIVDQLARKLSERYSNEIGLDALSIKKLRDLRNIIHELLKSKNSIVYEPEETEKRLNELFLAVKKMILFRSIPTKGALSIDVFSRREWKHALADLLLEPIRFNQNSLVDRLLAGSLRHIAMGKSSLDDQNGLMRLLDQSYNSTLISFYQMCEWFKEATLIPSPRLEKETLEEETKLLNQLWELGYVRQEQFLIDAVTCSMEITEFLEDESIRHLQIPLEQTQVVASKIDAIGFYSPDKIISKKDNLEIVRYQFHESVNALCKYFANRDNERRILDAIKACGYKERVALKSVLDQIRIISPLSRASYA